LVDAGLFSSLFCGLIGLGEKFPPQFGHVPLSAPSTQSLQNVHSKVHMRALSESGGKSQSQRSQFGLSSSMIHFLSIVGEYQAEYQFEYRMTV